MSITLYGCNESAYRAPSLCFEKPAKPQSSTPLERENPSSASNSVKISPNGASAGSPPQSIIQSSA